MQTRMRFERARPKHQSSNHFSRLQIAANDVETARTVEKRYVLETRVGDRELSKYDRQPRRTPPIQRSV